jgi:hypothetical protein
VEFIHKAKVLQIFNVLYAHKIDGIVIAHYNIKLRNTLALSKMLPNPPSFLLPTGRQREVGRGLRRLFQTAKLKQLFLDLN